jgi:hypothetical protein
MPVLHIEVSEEIEKVMHMLAEAIRGDISEVFLLMLSQYCEKIQASARPDDLEQGKFN